MTLLQAPAPRIRTGRRWLPVAGLVALLLGGLGLARPAGPGLAPHPATSVGVGAHAAPGSFVALPTRDWAGRPAGVLLPHRPTAVVILLHSLSHAPTQVEQQSGLIPVARAERWALIAPTGVDGSWNAGACCGYARDHEIDDVGYLGRAVAAAVTAAHAPVPVVLVGVSNGGMLALADDCSGQPDLSLVVAVSGNLQIPACPKPRAPFVLVRGSDDRLVPVAGSRWSAALRTALAPDSRGDDAMTDGLRCGPGRVAHHAPAVLTSWSCPSGVSRRYDVLGAGHGWPVGSFDTTGLIRTLVDDRALPRFGAADG